MCNKTCPSSLCRLPGARRQVPGGSRAVAQPSWHHGTGPARLLATLAEVLPPARHGEDWASDNCSSGGTQTLGQQQHCLHGPKANNPLLGKPSDLFISLCQPAMKLNVTEGRALQAGGSHLCHLVRAGAWFWFLLCELTEDHVIRCMKILKVEDRRNKLLNTQISTYLYHQAPQYLQKSPPNFLMQLLTQVLFIGPVLYRTW